ncbi:MAG: hypothetical protein V7K64_03495 [Nostoc sp.]
MEHTYLLDTQHSARAKRRATANTTQNYIRLPRLNFHVCAATAPQQ